MNFQPRTYSCLHDYLDALFEGKTPSKEAIIEAKKVYWRAYNTRLKKQQRQKKTEVTISFYKEEIKTLKSRLSDKQTISQFIKQVVTNELQSKKGENVSTDAFDSLEQQLFLLIEYLEHLLFQSENLDKRNLHILKKHLKTLQQLFKKHFS